MSEHAGSGREKSFLQLGWFLTISSPGFDQGIEASGFLTLCFPWDLPPGALDTGLEFMPLSIASAVMQH